MKEVLYKYSVNGYNSVEHSKSLPIDRNDAIYNSIRMFQDKKKYHYLKEKDYKDEETFEKNFANPLFSVMVKRVMIVVEKYDNKVSIKLFEKTKRRLRGNVYFTQENVLNYFTVNLKTGDYYIGTLSDYKKKKKTTGRNFRKNPTYYNALENFKVLIRGTLNTSIFMEPLHLGSSIHSVPELAIRHLLEQVDVKETNGINLHNVKDKILLFYLQKKNIKYPNNYEKFFWANLSWGYTTSIRLKELRKYDNNLITAIMAISKLSGKKIRKALHECDKIKANIPLLKSIISFLGYETLSKDYDFILAIINYPKEPPFNFLNYDEEINNTEITKSDMAKIYFLLRESIIHNEIDMYSICDHILFYKQLKRYGETDIKWKATDAASFRVEHLNWVEKLEYYRIGSYTRIYPEYLINKLNSSFTVKDDTYFPVLLKTTNEFVEESSSQSNCVKTYIGRPSVIIVSLRKNNTDTTDRATIEYILKKKDEKITISRVQYLGRYNSSLNDNWKYPMEKLDEIMQEYVSSDFFDTVKIQKELKNGKILHSDSEWDGDKLVWSLRQISDNYYYE